jgi:hypothetical protein
MILTVSPPLFPLYIDPGTGSMLFSLFISLAAVFYFFFRAVLIKIKFLISGRKSRGESSCHHFVIYNEARQYWNVFKPVIDEFEKRGIPILYLTSVRNDPFFDNAYSHIAGEYIGAENKAFARLNFLEADICLMTTPGLDVYQLKRSKFVRHYSHILHDTGDVSCYRLFGIDWFDSILLSGEYQIKDIRELEKLRGTPRKELAVVGSTYLDIYGEMLQKLPGKEEDPFTVLVSPSWGPGSLLSVFGFKLLDPLIETDWRIIVRPHPQSKTSETSLLALLEERYKSKPNILWDYSPENINTLSKSDVMISDFSGIIFDFIFLFNRPVFYSNAAFNMEMYDAGDLDHPPWKFEAVKKFGMELNERDLSLLPNLIKKASVDSRLSGERENAKKFAWQNTGKAAQATVDFLTRLQESLDDTAS